MAVKKDSSDPLNDLMAGVVETPKAPEAPEAPQAETIEVPKPETPEAPEGKAPPNIAKEISKEDKKEEKEEEKTETEKMADELRGKENPKEKEEKKEASISGDKKEEKEESKGPIEDWDKVTEVKGNDKQNLEKVAFELGLKDTKPESIIDSYKNLQKELETAKNQKPEDLFADETLRKANEIAKSGGNWVEFLALNTVDYSKISDRELVASEMQKLGVVDTEESKDLTEHLDGMSSADLKLKANDIRQRLVSQQNTAKDNLSRQAEESKRRVDSELRNALNSIEEISGFKVNPHHKKQIYDDLTTNSIMKAFFQNDEGNVDMRVAAENTFKLRNFDKLLEYYKAKGQNEGKRQVLDKLENVEIESKPVPTEQTKSPEKEPSIQLLDLMKEGKGLNAYRT